MQQKVQVRVEFEGPLGYFPPLDEVSLEDLEKGLREIQEEVERRSPSLQPVGHITDLIRKLDRWKCAREYHGLQVSLLITTITYLEDYRKLVYRNQKYLSP